MIRWHGDMMTCKYETGNWIVQLDCYPAEMDRSWIHETNRVSQRFKDGVIQFLDVARNSLNSNGETLCPCRKCANILIQTLPAIQAHICTYGFISTYIIWNKHGELNHVAVEYSDSSSESEGIEAAIHDA